MLSCILHHMYMYMYTLTGLYNPLCLCVHYRHDSRSWWRRYSARKRTKSGERESWRPRGSKSYRTRSSRSASHVIHSTMCSAHDNVRSSDNFRVIMQHDRSITGM